MSVFKGRPIHHYAGHDDATLRNVFGMDDGEIEEARRRLGDIDYDREAEANDALNVDLAMHDANAWVEDPLLPVPGAPEVYTSSTIGGPRSVEDQIEEARFSGELERRQELAKEREEAARQGEEDVKFVEKRNVDAEVRAIEAEIELKRRKVEAVREKASDREEETRVESPTFDTSPAGPRRVNTTRRSASTSPEVREEVKTEPRDPNHVE